ncbi:MAG TPA: DUF1731 domain-containing protein, partial [Caldilinea sp.]|nr:DUF1731 domain-containing protein [Caldilinea sp.]
NLTAPNPVTNQEFGQIVGEVLGRPSFVPAPGFAMKAVFGEMSVVLLEGQRAIPQKLLDLGFKFKFETAQAAVRALLDTSAHANGVVAPAAGAPTSPTPTAAENKDKSPAVAGKE